MPRVAWFVVAALSLPLIAHADQPIRTPLVGEHQQDWSLLDPARARDIAFPPPGATPEPANHAAVSNIIYLNRCTGGCTITKTDYPRSSATGNNTWIIGDTQATPAGTQFHISEFAFSQAVWDEVVQCVKDVYAPYNVQVVTEDPTPALHHEALVAGTSTDYGIPANEALGKAELGAGFCSPKDNAISLNIANDHTPGSGMTLAQNICWTVAQETAHSWGLDHEIECTDALTYDFSSCGQRFFRNKNSACGEVGITGPRSCVCGGNQQNTHGKVLAVFGAGTGPQLTPTIRVDQPTAGSQFPRGNKIFATVFAGRGMKHLEVYVNGWKWVDQPATTNSTFQIALPDEVPDGVMDLRVRACDDIEVCGEQTVTVTRGAPCTGVETCLAGQTCEGGKCAWPPPSVDLGGACEINQQCLSLLCADIGAGELACTESCQGPPNDLCPEGFHCNAQPAQEGVCRPDGAEETGCCSVDHTGRGAMLANVGLGGLIALLVARRRRRR